MKGALTGNRLPLVLISHGTSGSLASHYDTALELARAGFVVAAVTHAGDNSQDQSYVGNRLDLIERPRQIKCVLDYLLGAWQEHNRLDPACIGIFGFSLGGFTALVAIGGTPDLQRIPQFCSEKPEAPECRFIREHHGDQLDEVPTSEPTWIHDARIKAAVVAAGFAAVGTGAAAAAEQPNLPNPDLSSITVARERTFVFGRDAINPSTDPITSFIGPWGIGTDGGATLDADYGRISALPQWAQLACIPAPSMSTASSPPQFGHSKTISRSVTCTPAVSI